MFLNQRFMKIVILLLLFFLLSGYAFAQITDYYVKQTGNDVNANLNYPYYGNQFYS